MPDPTVIRVDDLRKVYTVPEREPGLRASVRSLWKRQTKDVVAVGGIGFEVPEGEIVGFLGPNGAGKIGCPGEVGDTGLEPVTSTMST